MGDFGPVRHHHEVQDCEAGRIRRNEVAACANDAGVEILDGFENEDEWILSFDSGSSTRLCPGLAVLASRD